MKATAIIYQFPKKSRNIKEKIRRDIFGYNDGSNKGQYTYQRTGSLTPHIKEKWGKSVVIIERTKEILVTKLLNKHQIKHQKRKIVLED